MRFVPRLPEERANVAPGGSRSELAWLLGGGVAALGLLLWLAGVGADALAGRISPARERAMFAAVAAQVRLDDDADRERLAPLLDRLAPAPPRPALGVLAGPELNALALPGRAILVTRGLLDEVDDDELAFVLAHELAHLDHRDNLRALGRGLMLTAALSLLGIDTGASPTDLAGLVSRASLTRTSRDAERAADAAAVRRLLAHGLDATAAPRLLERLSEKEGRGDRRLAWLATHPLGSERIAAVQALLPEPGSTGEGGMTPGLARRASPAPHSREPPP